MAVTGIRVLSPKRAVRSKRTSLWNRLRMSPVIILTRPVAEDNLRIRSNGPSCVTSLEGDGCSSILCERQKHVEHTANASKAVLRGKILLMARLLHLTLIMNEQSSRRFRGIGGDRLLNQQHMILSMENKSLRQRVKNLSQEQLIKTFEHDILEREVGRLSGLYHHQQQQQRQLQEASSGHKRSNSKDLNLEFSNLSLKH